MKILDAHARAVLSGSLLFQKMTLEELDKVLAGAVERRFARGATILRRGDPGVGMFFIATGRVRVSLISEEGKEVTLSVLGPGETLGEMSLIDGEDCSADAAALEDCLLIFIERTRFLYLLRNDVELCLKLLALLTGRLRRSNAALEDIALLDLPARLGRLLLRLARDFGVRDGSRTRIEVRLTQRDLSNLVGSTREKVNKQLRQWEHDRVLGKDNGRIVVIQPGSLGMLDSSH
jgi:CRP/FNR family transcriptional regulator, cyclic AMP receptor protein